jgi:hypothetical protein
MPQIVPQKQFETIDDFINGSNNYYALFLDDCDWGLEHRETYGCFRRFQAAYPEMERQVTRATVQAVRAGPLQKLPWERLWETYKLMSQFVFADDKYATHDGQPHREYLIR